MVLAAGKMIPEPQMVEIGKRIRFIVYLAQPLALDGTSSPPLSKTEPTEQVTEQVQRLLFCLPLVLCASTLFYEELAVGMMGRRIISIRSN